MTTKDRIRYSQLEAIVTRYEKVTKTKVKDRTSLMMDLHYVRDAECPFTYPKEGNLNIKRLMAFDDFSFVHDVSGISGRIIRPVRGKDGCITNAKQIGLLKNCFDPRCGFLAQSKKKVRFVGTLEGSANAKKAVATVHAKVARGKKGAK